MGVRSPLSRNAKTTLTHQAGVMAEMGGEFACLVPLMAFRNRTELGGEEASSGRGKGVESRRARTERLVKWRM